MWGVYPKGDHPPHAYHLLDLGRLLCALSCILSAASVGTKPLRTGVLSSRVDECSGPSPEQHLAQGSTTRCQRDAVEVGATSTAAEVHGKWKRDVHLEDKGVSVCACVCSRVCARLQHVHVQEGVCPKPAAPILSEQEHGE